MKAAAKQDTPEEWADAAEKNAGSWWTDWVEMLKDRSGEEIAAPKEHGSKKHKTLGAAPGTYVFDA